VTHEHDIAEYAHRVITFATDRSSAIRKRHEANQRPDGPSYCVTVSDVSPQHPQVDPLMVTLPMETGLPACTAIVATVVVLEVQVAEV